MIDDYGLLLSHCLQERSRAAGRGAERVLWDALYAVRGPALREVTSTLRNEGGGQIRIVAG